MGGGGFQTDQFGPLFFYFCTRAIVYRVLRLSHSLGVCALFLSPSRSKGWGSCIDPGDFKGWRRAHRTRSKACVLCVISSLSFRESLGPGDALLREVRRLAPGSLSSMFENSSHFWVRKRPGGYEAHGHTPSGYQTKWRANKSDPIFFATYFPPLQQ